MKKLNKKGFTIVELVIVIAVIAILAAVLIPTFASLINKANLSADQVAIRNMNTALAAENATGKIAGPGDARKALLDAGFNAENLIPTTKDHKFFWYSEDNVVLLVNADDVVVYPNDYKNMATDEFEDDTLHLLSTIHHDESHEHDWVGIYCTICQHPAADVEIIDDFTKDGDQGKMGVVSGWGPLQGTGNFEVFLDVAYSFKAIPEELGIDGSNSLDEAFQKLGEEALDYYSTYKNWLCDFYVSFSAEIEKDSCGLGGYYEQFGMAIAFTAPDKIDANVEIPLLGSVIGGGWTYEQIISDVGEFKCGFFNLDNNNIGKVFTVKLRMTNPEDESDFIDVAVINHTISAVSSENAEAFSNATN